MPWDPEVESPASIAVIGLGPVGIEAALYARFLGYNVDLYDTGRPARAATRWNRRAMDATVAECTTSLGHAALEAQDENYRRPDPNRVFSGREFAEEYLTPVAKTDLLHDFVHINSPVVEVGRYRTSLPPRLARSYGRGAVGEEGSSFSTDLLQERANDEFRLLIDSRDRGLYTARADLVLDCRGHWSGEGGWGPAGSRTIGTDLVRQLVHQWLPGDTRFEATMFSGKRVLLFGQSLRACLFAREWAERSTSDFPDSSLMWIIPSVSNESDTATLEMAAQMTNQIDEPKRFSSIFGLGIDRIQRSDDGVWRLQWLLPDDSTVELSGDVFAPYPSFRETPSIGPELLSQENLCRSPAALESVPEFYPEYAGWRVATFEPHYYKLGSFENPHHASGLGEAYNQIRDLFALLGTRRELDLYRQFNRPAESE